jgi:hypothetical protein
MRRRERGGSPWSGLFMAVKGRASSMLTWVSDFYAFVSIARGSMISWVIAVGSLGILAFFVLSIWNGWPDRVSDTSFRWFRKILAILVAAYAGWCAFRLINNVAIPRSLGAVSLAPGLVREVIAYSIFWVLAPPIWFFVEYFAIENDWITPVGPNAAANAADVAKENAFAAAGAAHLAATNPAEVDTHNALIDASDALVDAANALIAARDAIGGAANDKEKKLKTIKDYADYASKIWAGVLALLLGLIAFKT